jgi:hypothetical protein
MKKIAATIGLLSLFGAASAQDYSEGQVWTYKTRPGEELSTVQIDKIETNERLGKVFHISIEGVRVSNPHVAGGFTTELPHIPVSEETLNKSLLKLIATREPNPRYMEGYQTWKKAFDAGHAGIFSLSVSEIVGVVEHMNNRK